MFKLNALPMLGRQSPRRVILSFVMVTSLLLNVYFLLNWESRSSKREAWASKTKNEGVWKVMRYVELERETDDVVKEEFVNRIWGCMKENLSLSLSIDNKAADYIRWAKEAEATAANRSHRPPTSRKLFLSKPVVNAFNYSYIYNKAEVCAKERVDLIFASPSAPSNFERRRKMRSGVFGNFTKNPRHRAKLLFFLAAPFYSEGQEPSSAIQDKIELEQAEHEDLVQATFLDKYADINFKGLLIPKWCSDFCPNSKFVIRVDDDVSANVKDIISALEVTRQKYEHFVLGLLLKTARPERHVTSKYFSSLEDYPYKMLPPYVLGGCMGYPVKTGELLYEACRRVRPVYWIDDVWISSMCATRVNIPVLDNPAFHFKHGDHWA